MKLRVVSLVALIVLTSCSKSLVSMKRTAIFSETQAPHLLRIGLNSPDGVTSFWKPSESDLSGIETHLEAYLGTVWKGKKSMPDWQGYYRQIAGIVRNGERQLFISYAWEPYMNNLQIEADRKKEAKRRGQHYNPEWWKTENIFVDDGGSMFFRVIYSPKSGQFIWYDQNVGF